MTTEAGRRLLERESYNARSFPLIDVETIAAIEAEARAALLAELEAGVSVLSTTTGNTFWRTDPYNGSLIEVVDLTSVRDLIRKAGKP